MVREIAMMIASVEQAESKQNRIMDTGLTHLLRLFLKSSADVKTTSTLHDFVLVIIYQITLHFLVLVK